MSSYRPQSVRRPQHLAGKAKEKEMQRAPTIGSVQGPHESTVIRTLLSTSWRYSSTPSLKSASLDKTQHLSSSEEARAAREPQEETGDGRSHDLKRRASATGLVPLDRQPNPHRVSPKKSPERRGASDTISLLVTAKKSTNADMELTRKRRRRESATSDRPGPPMVRTKDLSAMGVPGNTQETPKKTPSRQRSTHGQAKPRLKPTISITALVEDVEAASQPPTSIESNVPTISEEKAPSHFASQVSPESNRAEAERPTSAESPITEDSTVSEPTKDVLRLTPKARKTPSTPRTQTPRPEHLAILGPLANFIPNPTSISFPIPPPPSPPLPPTTIPLSKSPKNATRVRFGDTTIHTYTITVNLGRHLTPIGPNQFKTRSGLSYVHPPTDSLEKKPKMGLRIIDFFPSGKVGAKQRRHRERQAAMRRYWLRIEEEEKLEREECMKRAEGVVERYAEEQESSIRLEEVEPGHKAQEKQVDVELKATRGKGAQDQKIRVIEETNEKGKDLQETDMKDHRELSVCYLVMVDRPPVQGESENPLLSNGEEKRLANMRTSDGVLKDGKTNCTENGTAPVGTGLLKLISQVPN